VKVFELHDVDFVDDQHGRFVGEEGFNGVEELALG
jgi:hypothetical protein